MKRTTLLALIMPFFLAVQATANNNNSNDMENLKLTETWDKTFPKSEKVNHRKVTFVTRFDITIAADLYEPKNIGVKLAAVVIGGPGGAVKEQASGFYARTLAERGFIAIAFDPSFTGESSGKSRGMSSPDINTEEYSAAIDYLVTLPEVDEERIGIIGICAYGGHALNAAAMDYRAKATVASTMYDISRVNRQGYFDSTDTPEARNAARKAVAAERTADARAGKISQSMFTVPNSVTGEEPQFVLDYYDYYKTKRGYHERSINSNGSWQSLMGAYYTNMPINTMIGEIDRAVMIVHGENAHSRYLGEAAFKNLQGDNKKLVIIPGATHCDLYDRKAPFDEIEQFFNEYLK